MYVGTAGLITRVIAALIAVQAVVAPLKICVAEEFPKDLAPYGMSRLFCVRLGNVFCVLTFNKLQKAVIAAVRPLLFGVLRAVVVPCCRLGQSVARFVGNILVWRAVYSPVPAALGQVRADYDELVAVVWANLVQQRLYSSFEHVVVCLSFFVADCRVGRRTNIC